MNVIKEPILFSEVLEELAAVAGVDLAREDQVQNLGLRGGSPNAGDAVVIFALLVPRLNNIDPYVATKITDEDIRFESSFSFEESFGFAFDVTLPIDP